MRKLALVVSIVTTAIAPACTEPSAPTPCESSCDEECGTDVPGPEDPAAKQCVADCVFDCTDRPGNP